MLALGVFLGFALFAAVPIVPGQTSSIAEVEVNQRIVDDYLRGVRSQMEERQLSLDSKFSVEYRIILQKNGSWDAQKLSLTKSSGDAKLIASIGHGIVAFGDAGYFSYLSNLGVHDAVVSISNDGENFTARVAAAAGTVNKAKSISSGLNAIVFVAKAQAKTENDRLVLENTSVSADKTNAIITLSITKSIVEQLIW